MLCFFETVSVLKKIFFLSVYGLGNVSDLNLLLFLLLLSFLKYIKYDTILKSILNLLILTARHCDGYKWYYNHIQIFIFALEFLLQKLPFCIYWYYTYTDIFITKMLCNCFKKKSIKILEWILTVFCFYLGVGLTFPLSESEEFSQTS